MSAAWRFSIRRRRRPGRLSCDDLQAVLEERLPLLPPFRWKLAEVPLSLDYPYWIDDTDFDIDFHVREIALPAPGSTTSSRS